MRPVNRRYASLSVCLLATSLILGGCQSAPTPTGSASPDAGSASPIASGSASPSPSASPGATPSGTPGAIPAEYANLPRLEGEATVVITVAGEAITIKVDGKNAPLSAGNFVDLVQKGVYNGTVFHRVVRQPQPFVVQGGDPLSSDPNASPQTFGTGSYIDPATKNPRFVPLEIKASGQDSPTYGMTLEEATAAKRDPSGSQGATPVPVLRHNRGAVAMARSADPNSASAQFYFALGDLYPLDGNYAVFGTVTEGMEVVDKIEQGAVIESAQVTAGAENLKGAK
jgi:peptidyl-prolyl cis-trans isomerase B (cyclophilin B)